MSEFDRVRVLWPDHLGLARGKYLPAELASAGTGHCATTFALGYDRSMIPAPGTYLLDGLRDVHATLAPETLRQGWDDATTGVAVADLALDGEPYAVSARHALARAVADWGTLGYHPQVGLELEAYVMQPDGHGGWERYATPRSMVYGTGPGSDPVGVITAITRTADACGIPVESINAEFDEAQFELTLRYDDAMKAADDAFLFRVMAREVALAHGLDLTFLGKPYADLAGSGVHVNVSLVDDAGVNQLQDRSTDDGLSDLARGCLAGLVHHHPALGALCAPTVNAYRRLQPGQLNGYWANWGFEHRCAANRIPAERGQSTRIENRVADGAVNLHLGVAAVLQAARLGVVDGLECPPPLTTDGFEEVDTDRSVGACLEAALDDLVEDHALVEAVGPDLVANFEAVKRAEWDRYLETVGHDAGGTTVTHWELDEYLMYH